MEPNRTRLHQRNENQNHNEVSLHRSPTGYQQKVYKKKKMLERVWRKGKSKLVQPLWKTVRGLLRKLKIELPYDPASPLLCIYSHRIII